MAAIMNYRLLQFVRRAQPCKHTEYPDSSTSLETRQQCQCVLTANLLEIICREIELHHAFSCFGERDDKCRYPPS